jgi:hypothetical protein
VFLVRFLCAAHPEYARCVKVSCLKIKTASLTNKTEGIFALVLPIFILSFITTKKSSTAKAKKKIKKRCFLNSLDDYI